MKQVGENIYVEDQFSIPPYERGCNPAFIVTSDGVVMVDTPMMPTDVVKWRTEINHRGKVLYIINTHHHPDHIAGNYFFGGTVISHELIKEEFNKPITSKTVSKPALKNARYPLAVIDGIRLEIQYSDPQGISFMEHYQLREPAITFSKELNLYLGRQRIELIHQPGHTAGHIGVYAPNEKAFFTGDNFTNHVQPLLSNCLPYEWIKSLKQIEAMDIDYVIPGHGEVCTRREVREFRQFIETCLGIIKDAIQKGISREEAADKISFENLYPAVHPGPEQQRLNVLWLYDVLSKYNTFSY